MVVVLMIATATISDCELSMDVININKRGREGADKIERGQSIRIDCAAVPRWFKP